jgi:hypothetical protein
LVCTHPCSRRAPRWRRRNNEPDWRHLNTTDEFKINAAILHSPVVTICTTSLTSNNYAFCPHSGCMCFVWIWEQTAIISLYSTNWLFLWERRSVYCAVRTGSVNVIQINGFSSSTSVSMPVSFHQRSIST